MSDYEATIRAVLSIPFVKELNRENKHLRKELKALKNLIYSLPEFRRDNNVSTQRTQVKIKKEPGLVEEDSDDDVVILDTPKNPKENIVYVIDDSVSLQAGAQAGAQASEAQASEEEASEAQASEEEASEAQADEEASEAQAGEEASEEEASEEEAGEEDSGEVFEITIAGKAYYTTNEKNGKIYAIDADEEVGDEIGAFKNGKPVFNKPNSATK